MAQVQEWLASAQQRYGALLALVRKAVFAYRENRTDEVRHLNQQVEAALTKLSPDQRRELKDFCQQLIIRSGGEEQERRSALTERCQRREERREVLPLGALKLVAPERYRLTGLILKAIQNGFRVRNYSRIREVVLEAIAWAKAQALECAERGQFDRASFFSQLAQDLRSAAPRIWFQPRPPAPVANEAETEPAAEAQVGGTTPASSEDLARLSDRFTVRHRSRR
jgi:hypothetical protein